ncbi:uncharacterized protein ELE39_001002 [Cryptosporidium sp. chipmunk genotype I]|uniref:uncharacterized protein n=1 Tax=Cryptosporidium sp. chipmunk genotype I TaxID=1280935 RepID=UPI00351A6ED6|nr:hypothetical protein ELE39_001002 [Cryptosporidium sp. chipmunk genotype I]
MKYIYVISALISSLFIVNAFVLQKKEGLDLGLKKNLIQSADSSKFECTVAMECINVLRYYYFFVAIVYEIISTSNCISRSSDTEFRMHLSKKLSELNYYRNYFAEHIMDKGGNAFLFEVIHEFPKRKASFLNVCSQIKFIDAKELYVIEQRVISNYLKALLELKKYIGADISILSDSPLLLNQKREVIKIINMAIEIILITQNEVQNLKKSSIRSTSIYHLSKIPQKLQVIRIYKSYLIVRISHVVKLRQYIKADRSELLTMLEELERNNKMPPKY